MINVARFRPSFALTREHRAGGTSAYSSGQIGVFLFWGLIAYLSTSVFEGPLRYALSLVGAGTFVYLRDLLMVVAISLGLISVFIQRKHVTTPLVVVIYVLLVYFFLGLLVSDNPLFSSLFGLKIFGVFLFGMAAATAVAERPRIFLRVVYIFLILTLIGVAGNYAVGKFPWEGLIFETSFGFTSTTKEWWTEGGRRLPGFTRASYDAAMVIGISFALIVPTLSRVRAIVIGCVCLAAVYLTTSKGMMMALSVLILWWSLVPPMNRNRMGALIAIGLLSLMFVLPMVSCSFDFGHRFIGEVPRALSSFADRIVDMWPRSCAILKTPQSWVIGAGIGSIGVPQQYSWVPTGYSAADNLFVYLFVNGGILWAFGLAATVFVGLRHDRAGCLLDDNRVRSLLIVMLGYGITTNMQEQPFFAMIAGVLVAQVWNSSSISRV
jgi:hypothetical protein